MVTSILEAANPEGLALWISSEATQKEPEIYQHYTNLRIDWNIQITKINN
jgi:hypothetical protein